MTIKGKKVGFGITASFCTVLDILEPMQELVALGAEVYPVISGEVLHNSSRFHDKDDFIEQIKLISGRAAASTIAAAEAFGPKTPLDIMLIAPATGSTAARLANGITDSAVLMAAKATLRNNKPVLLALFSNDALGANGVNIMRLYNTKNVYFVPFGQDDPHNKPNSMTADLSRLNNALLHALEGKQVQPSIITKFTK